MGFRPQPVWTARTVLTRMPGWTLSRNASSEVQRALDVKPMGIDKVLELKPTDPEKTFIVPKASTSRISTRRSSAVARGANNLRGTSRPPKPASAAAVPARDVASFVTAEPVAASSRTSGATTG